MSSCLNPSSSERNNLEIVSLRQLLRQNDILRGGILIRITVVPREDGIWAQRNMDISVYIGIATSKCSKKTGKYKPKIVQVKELQKKSNMPTSSQSLNLQDFEKTNLRLSHPIQKFYYVALEINRGRIQNSKCLIHNNAPVDKNEDFTCQGKMYHFLWQRDMDDSFILCDAAIATFMQ